MANWFVWLLSAVGPIVKKVLASLGVGWVTFTALTAFAIQLRDYVVAAWGTMPGDLIAIASMSGFGTALGIILGAFAYKASLSAISYLGRVVS